MNFFRPDAVSAAQKARNDLAARVAKIAIRTTKARADLAELDAAPLDLDDEAALAKASKRRREAADLLAALEAQGAQATAAREAAELALAAAQEQAATGRGEEIRAEAPPLDEKILARLRSALVEVLPDAIRLADLVEEANALRAAGAEGNRPKPPRVLFAARDLRGLVLALAANAGALR